MDTDRAKQALIAAHKAGDIEAATKIAQALRSQSSVQQTASEEPVFTPPKVSLSDKIVGSQLGRLATGAASVVTAPFQLGAHAADYVAQKMGRDDSNRITVSQAIDDQLRTLREKQQRGMYGLSQVTPERKLMAQMVRTPEQQAKLSALQEGDLSQFDAANLIGSAAVGTGILKGKDLGTTLTSKIGRGALAGGLIAPATVPVTNGGDNYWGDKAAQLLGGAAIGATMPLAGAALGKGYEWTRDIADLFRSKGPQRILDRFTENNLIGNSGQQLEQALRSAPVNVSGSLPTAAEAVSGLPQGTAIQAHQATVAQTPAGGISGRFGQRTADQQAAREAAIETFARDKAALEAAKAARSAAANAEYGEAYQQAIKADPQLLKLSENPYFQDALPDAIRLAKANNVDLKSNLTQFLHYVKIGMDKQLRRTGDAALDTTEKEAVQSVKTALTNWMGQKNPLYGTARANYARDSKPINQMEVGQELLRKLTAPTGKESPGTFLKAAEDATGVIKTATGMPRQQLGQVLTPQQLATTEAVARDLERALAAKNPLQRTAIPGGVDVAEHAGVRLPNMLSRPALIINSILRSRGANIEPKVDALAADRYLDPVLLANAIRNILNKSNNTLLTPNARQQLSLLLPTLGYAQTMGQ